MQLARRNVFARLGRGHTDPALSCLVAIGALGLGDFPDRPGEAMVLFDLVAPGFAGLDPRRDPGRLVNLHMR